MCVLQNVGPHKLGLYPQVLKVSFMHLMEKRGLRNQTKVCPDSMEALLMQGLQKQSPQMLGDLAVALYRAIIYSILQKKEAFLAPASQEKMCLGYRGWEIKRRNT